MVRCGDDYRIDILRLLIEHFAEVGIDAGAGIFPENRRREALVDIAQGHDPFAAAALQAPPAPPAYADTRDPQGIAGGLMPLTAEHVPGYDHRRNAGGDGAP